MGVKRRFDKHQIAPPEAASGENVEHFPFKKHSMM
jgi:hypothetical protein